MLEILVGKLENIIGKTKKEETMYKLNKKKKEKLRKKRIRQIMNKASLFEEIREEIDLTNREYVL